MSDPRPPTLEELREMQERAKLYEFVVPVSRPLHDCLIAEIERLRALCGKVAREIEDAS